LPWSNTEPWSERSQVDAPRMEKKRSVHEEQRSGLLGMRLWIMDSLLNTIHVLGRQESFELFFSHWISG
jgi:hypothetical protein